LRPKTVCHDCLTAPGSGGPNCSRRELESKVATSKLNAGRDKEPSKETNPDERKTPADGSDERKSAGDKPAAGEKSKFKKNVIRIATSESRGRKTGVEKRGGDARE